jgi:hypothetical protein
LYFDLIDSLGVPRVESILCSLPRQERDRLRRVDAGARISLRLAKSQLVVQEMHGLEARGMYANGKV